MSSMKTRGLAALAGTAAILVSGVPLATSAHAGDDVRVSGRCSAHATWKLKAKPDDGRLEVEAEVDSNVSGQTWRWRILHNGSVTAHGTKQTTGPSGSFEVNRRVVDLAGRDTIGFRATNPASGETCRGSLHV